MRGQRRSQQRLGVWMQRVRAEFRGLGHLYELSEVHHGDAMAYMRHSGEVVANEQVAHPQRRLQLLQLIHDLRSD
jgi:hypothetical protein